MSKHAILKIISIIIWNKKIKEFGLASDIIAHVK